MAGGLVQDATFGIAAEGEGQRDSRAVVEDEADLNAILPLMPTTWESNVDADINLLKADSSFRVLPAMAFNFLVAS